MTAPSEAVRAYLAERDHPCPGCGYNLRGVEQAQCPECGRGIELELVGKRDRGTLWFLLLALGWVLLASGMNGTRAGLEVWRQSDPSPFSRFVSFFGSPGAAAPTVVTRQWQGGGGSYRFRSSFQSTVTINGTPIITTPAAITSGPRNWGNVSTMSWVTLGWWALLFLAALNFLLMAWFVARRRGLERLRVLAPAAGFVFLCYAGFHIVMFVRELTA